MPYDTLLLDQSDAVLTITVNRPEVLNAQSRILREELDSALAGAAEDAAVRVVVIAGAGGHFSAGHDIGSPQEKADQAARPYPPGIPGRYQRGWDLNVANTLRWRDFPKPTIARVQGYCIMGGVILASACDLIVASDDARFCDRTVRWGGAHVQYASLPWEIGFRKAKEYLFTGDWMTAAEAERLGFVNRVVPRERLVEETLTLAKRVAMQEPFALRLCKASLNQMQDEMGFRTAITGAYATYSLSMERRVEQGQEFFSGADRAKRRDQAFGDHT